MARKNPDTTMWLLLAGGAVGVYLLLRSRKAAAATTKPSASRYVWRYFGRGADRDAVCRDVLTGQYVDDQLCEKALGPADAEQLEGVGWWW